MRVFDIVKDLYEPFETVNEPLTAELRFINEKSVRSEWMFLDDLEFRRARFTKIVNVFNRLARYDAYISANAHRWEAVDAKAREAGTLDVKGDKTTVYPYIAGLTWDIDITALHSGASTDWFAELKRFLERKFNPFLKELGLTPRYVLFTGGGLQVRWKADDLYPISLLDRMEALNDVLNAFLEPEGKSDNIFDPPRITRIPGTWNWKYVEPRQGLLLDSNLEEETNLEDLLKVLEFEARELGLKTPSHRPTLKGKIKAPSPKSPYVRKIDVDFVFQLLEPFYAPGYQNDLLVRLFSIFAQYQVNIFQALELLSRFVHHPKNTPGHRKNRLDHLTYAYGAVYAVVHRIPLTELYGPGIYEELAEFYNTLVADLGLKYSAKDFKRGLESNREKIAGWSSFRSLVEKIARAQGHDPEDAMLWANIVVNGLRSELEGRD